MDRQRATFVLWTIALLSLFVVAAMLGWKIFYGVVVPQANAVRSLSFAGMLAFSAFAGLMVNFGPCSLAVLPAYFSFYLGGRDADRARPLQLGARFGAIASIGLIGFYVLLGALLAVLGVSFAVWLTQLRLAIAALIFIAGALLFRGTRLAFPLVAKFQSAIAKKVNERKRRLLGVMGFGVVYGAGGILCFLPIFLPLVFYPMIGGSFFESMASFGVFAVVQALFLTGTTMLVSAGKRALLRSLAGGIQVVRRIAGVVLMLTGVYLFVIFLVLSS